MLRLGLIIAVGVVAVAIVLNFASTIVLTIDKLQSNTLISVYVGVIVALIAALILVYRRVLQGPRKPRYRKRPRPSSNPLARLREFYVKYGLYISRPVNPAELKSPRAASTPTSAAPPPGAYAQERRVLVCGVKGVGKSAIVRMLAEQSSVANGQAHVKELPALTTNAAENEGIAASARANDIVIFVVDQDLRNYEFRAFEDFARRGIEVIVALNKSDALRGKERDEVRRSVLAKLGERFPRERLVTVAAAPAPVVHVVTQKDGTEKQEARERAPQGADLISQVSKLLEKRGS